MIDELFSDAVIYVMLS